MYSADFYIRRIHSIAGIVPIGLFLMEHIFSISQALYGPEAFNKTVALLASVPFAVQLEVGAIGIPIAFHALFGLYITYVAKTNVLTYTYFRNWMFYLQRFTAVVTLAFVLWHVWVLRIGKALHGTEITFNYLSQILSDPLTFALYAIGLLSGVFHFANGIWAFLITWGITIGPRAQAVSMYVCGTLFLALSAFGLKALAAFIN